MKTLWLKKGEDRRIRAGHLWIFSNEIDSAKSPLPDFEPGENATLRDARGAVLGSVFVNPHSLICARLYSRKADLPLDADLLRQRLQSALGLRQRLYNQPWYRLCHGEGDLLPGLVMDRFGDHLTVQVGTWGMEARKEELREVLGELLQPRSILWDNDIAARSLEGLPRENESEGPVPDVLEVPENGCIFRAPLQGGQKTGWFYDQRRNRREAARYAAGADVLDIFCYAGGFGGTAAAAGARSGTPRRRPWPWPRRTRPATRPNWPAPRPSKACAAMPSNVWPSWTPRAAASRSSAWIRPPSSSAARTLPKAWPPTARSMPWPCSS